MAQADSPVIIKAPLTPKSDMKPHIVKLKVFWKHTHLWTDADIATYRTEAPKIAAAIQEAGIKHTCDKFALTVLVKFASTHGLPIKIKTGSGVFRNIVIYDSSLDEFDSNVDGYFAMALPHFTAHDVKYNATSLSGRYALQPGDLMVEDNALSGHVQVVMSADKTIIRIKQGNYPNDRTINGFFTSAKDKMAGKISSIFTGINDDVVPGSSDYLGVPIQDGLYWQSDNGTWHYRNVTLNRNDDNQVTAMNHLMKWNFNGFNS